MLITKNPTSNVTPDSGQAGTVDVSGISNTGHSLNTLDFNPGPGSQARSAKWSGFQSANGQIKSIKLKVDWTENGSIAAGGSNAFQMDYSVNGGSNWTQMLAHGSITASANGTAEVTLNNAQDLTQVQVRHQFSASAPTGSDSASVAITISNIRIEVETVDQVIVMM